VRVGLQVVDATRVERRGPAFDAVDIVALAKKKLSHVAKTISNAANCF
jgi:hypothetical protein